MSEILHVWALAPAAIGTCCLAADRRRVRAPEVVASALMLLAMLDLSRADAVVAPIYWAVTLIIAAMALAAVRGRRRRVGARGDAATLQVARGMALHTSIGMIAMAALIVAMGRTDAASMGHAHGMTSASFAFALAAGAAGYAAASVVAAVRAHGWLERVQFVAMGASTAVMGLALLG